MKTLKDIASDLAIFDSDDDQYIEALSVEEVEAAAAELNEMGEKAFHTFGLAAHITYSGRCGFADAGSVAFVTNRRSDRVVRATVRVHWYHGFNSGTSDRVKTIPAGSRIRLGCTKSGSVPVTEYSFSVIHSQEL